MSEPKRSGVAGTAAMLTIGLVILVPSGLCTGFFGVGALIDAVAHPENADNSLSFLGMALVLGGPFVAIGGLLVVLAIQRIRRASRGEPF